MSIVITFILLGVILIALGAILVNAREESEYPDNERRGPK